MEQKNSRREDSNVKRMAEEPTVGQPEKDSESVWQTPEDWILNDMLTRCHWKKCDRQPTHLILEWQMERYVDFFLDCDEHTEAFQRIDDPRSESGYTFYPFTEALRLAFLENWRNAGESVTTFLRRHVDPLLERPRCLSQRQLLDLRANDATLVSTTGPLIKAASPSASSPLLRLKDEVVEKLGWSNNSLGKEVWS